MPFQFQNWAEIVSAWEALRPQPLFWIVSGILLLIAAIWLFRVTAENIEKIAKLRKAKAVDEIANTFVPTWAAELLERDKRELSSRLVITDQQARWKQDSVEFDFDVLNASILDLTLEPHAVGQVFCGNVRLDTPLQFVATSGYDLPQKPGRVRKLKLRQVLDGSNWNAVRGGHREKAFSFGQVDIWCSSAAPDGTAGPRVRLPLPTDWHVGIPEIGPAMDGPTLDELTKQQ